MGLVLQVSQVLIVANRLPVLWEFDAIGPGDERVRRLVRAPGGLVSALGPIATQLQCAWVGTFGEEPGAARGTTPEPELSQELSADGIRLITVNPGTDLYDRYYRGFANQVLWPLFHGLPERMRAHDGGGTGASEHVLERGLEHEAAEWWRAYTSVNRAFAERIADVAEAAAVVWVNDYHLLLVPEMLRELRPDLRIAFFLHIPFPAFDLLAQTPWAEALIRGLCAADLIGVQRESDAVRLHDAQRALAADTAPSIQVFPASIDSKPYIAQARRALEAGEPAAIRQQYGLCGRKVLLSVDRLDYTKGVLERIAAFEIVLERWSGEEPLPVLLQVLTPTRHNIGAYREYAAEVRAATERVNARFESGSYRPIVTLSEPHSVADLTRLFLVADVMCVTPLRDGMNLVAKEYAVSRVDERGVLLLGKEAGSADELREAVIVDPRDGQDLVAGLVQALAMEATEQATRARALAARVRSNDVFAWATDFLDAAERCAVAE